MLKTENREKLLPILFTCVAVIGLLCALVFFLMSVTSSYYLGTDKYLGTIEELRPDNAYVNILALIIICCAIYLSSLYYDRISMKLLLVVLMVWTFISGFGFVYS
ncbi:MAG: hypothetical protein IJO77_00860, partial [Oscillospiraceae bacterium]|nr:hypothetical protein [Oscillospiraceae bacterium]